MTEIRINHMNRPTLPFTPILRSPPFKMLMGEKKFLMCMWTLRMVVESILELIIKLAFGYDDLIHWEKALCIVEPANFGLAVMFIKMAYV